MICPHCGKPRLTDAAACAHCGRPAAVVAPPEPEADGGPASVACLILMMLFVLVLILLPVFLLAGIFIR
jgi:uncharacterized protein (DUF983 family)